MGINNGENFQAMIVDPQPLLRRGVRNYLLETFGGDFDQEGWVEVSSGTEAFSALFDMEDYLPHVLITELCLKQGSGFDLIRGVVKKYSPHVSIIVYTSLPADLYEMRVLHTRAKGYVDKNKNPAELTQAIRRVMGGRLAFSEATVQHALGAVNGKPQPDNPLDVLTNRQLEVFELLGSGLATAQIAERLKLSPKTIDSYRDDLKERLNYTTSAEMIRHATEHVLRNSGLVPNESQ